MRVSLSDVLSLSLLSKDTKSDCRYILCEESSSHGILRGKPFLSRSWKKINNDRRFLLEREESGSCCKTTFHAWNTCMNCKYRYWKKDFDCRNYQTALSDLCLVRKEEVSFLWGHQGIFSEIFYFYWLPAQFLKHSLRKTLDSNFFFWIQRHAWRKERHGNIIITERSQQLKHK